MSSTKRKLQDILHQRVRARKEPSEEPEYLSDSEGESIEEDEDLEQGSDAPEGSQGSEGNDASEADISDSETDEGDEPEASAISFGALAKAQESLNGGSEMRKAVDEGPKGDGWENTEAEERRAGKKIRREAVRADKHAPTEMSSKKAVSRKRTVVKAPKRDYRDPRFGFLMRPTDQSRFSKAYSFLDEYREDEMKALREQIKKTKDEDGKEELKRSLLSMESRKKTQEKKRKEQEILDQHRKEEKEKVRQGKKPFYLKKSEQKKRVLLDQFSGLKEKQLDHVIERRRKKLAAKEKKKLPFARRNVE